MYPLQQLLTVAITGLLLTNLMSNHTFNFEVDGQALHYLCRAMDKYVEKWPGGHPEEQEVLKHIQYDLKKALLDYQLLTQD